VTTITRDNLDQHGYTSLYGEIKQAILDGRETAIDLLALTAAGREFAFFPNSRRGVVCEGGNCQWTVADSLDDLKDRWSNYEERWT
jgi:hypothetical protein